MADILYKYDDPTKPIASYAIFSHAFIIHKRNEHMPYCEEYDIIKKIQQNEEGYFDFSKNLIDIGAEDGNYAMLLDFNHNYCFEPNKASCCLLYANMYLKDKVYNTDVFCVGLGEKQGKAQFNGFECEVDGTYNIGYDDVHMSEIEIKTLDSFEFENVGLIKVDVEGYEENVLRGSIGTIIRNNYPPILFECWDAGEYRMTQEKHDSLYNFLFGLGYDIIEYWGDYETHLAIHR